MQQYFTKQPQVATDSPALTTLNLVFTVRYPTLILLTKSHQTSQGVRGVRNVHGENAGGEILIIPCCGYSHNHHRRAMCPSISVKLIKISQQQRLTGALCRLSEAPSMRDAGHNMETRKRVFQVCKRHQGMVRGETKDREREERS